jgi:hypothetical protein
MTLRELQVGLQRHLLTGDSDIVSAIVDAPPLNPEERLGIYRDAYRIRLIEALDNTYPVLHAILGDEMFEDLGREFVAAHSSVYRNIRWYGRELNNFLAHLSPYDAQPILAELASLEWTLSEVFDSPDAPVLSRQDFVSIAPDEWEGLVFELHPSLRRLDLAWNTVAAWQAVTDEQAPPEPKWSEQPVPWLLWRQNLKNYFRSLDGAESAALTTAVRGHTFGDICGTLTDWLSPEQVPLKAAGYINTWVQAGLISGLSSRS